MRKPGENRDSGKAAIHFSGARAAGRFLKGSPPDGGRSAIAVGKVRPLLNAPATFGAGGAGVVANLTNFFGYKIVVMVGPDSRRN